MHFRILGLAAETFAPLFALSDDLHVHFAPPGCYAARIERA
jgi:hypothetical protein